jgi:hypothetical protein
LEKERDGLLIDISNLKKELVKKDKLMDERLKQAT